MRNQRIIVVLLIGIVVAMGLAGCKSETGKEHGGATATKEHGGKEHGGTATR